MSNEWTAESFGLVMLNGRHMVTAFNYDEAKALVDAITTALDAAIAAAIKKERISKELWEEAAKKLDKAQQPLVDALKDLERHLLIGDTRGRAIINYALAKVKEGK